MRAVHVLAICAMATIGSAASAQEVDWKKVDEAIGRSAAVSGDVHRYGFPRTDLTVTLDGVTIKPALALGGGSGWVLLPWSPRDRKLVNQWASDHCHTLADGTPILALDMYEHSYHMDFDAKAASNVMDVIRWNNVQRLFVQTTNGRGTAGDTRQ